MAENKEKIESTIPELRALLHFMETRGVEVTTVLVVILLLLAGGLGYRNWSQRQREEAALRLAEAQSVEDLEALAEEYPKQPEAAAALLRAAKWHYEQGGYESAMRAYEDFLARFPEHPFVSAATLGLLHSQEAIGMLEVAQQGLERFIAEHSGHFLLPQALLSRARILDRTGELQKARELYEEVMVSYRDTGWEAYAEEMLERMELNTVQPPRAPRPAAAASAMQMPLMPQSADAPDQPLEPVLSLNAEDLRRIQAENKLVSVEETAEEPVSDLPGTVPVEGVTEEDKAAADLEAEQEAEQEAEVEEKLSDADEGELIEAVPEAEEDTAKEEEAQAAEPDKEKSGRGWFFGRKKSE